MRVAIVGSRDARGHLRARLASASIDVVAEYPTLSEARAADVDVDAFVVAPDVRDGDPGRARNRPDERAERRVRRQRDGDADDDRVRRQPDGHARRRPADAIVEPLTQRELQVLELLAEGLPNKSIAERLGISDQTVKFHVASISGKLGASNRTDAVRRAVRRGLLTL